MLPIFQDWEFGDGAASYTVGCLADPWTQPTRCQKHSLSRDYQVMMHFLVWRVRLDMSASICWDFVRHWVSPMREDQEADGECSGIVTLLRDQGLRAPFDPVLSLFSFCDPRSWCHLGFNKGVHIEARGRWGFSLLKNSSSKVQVLLAFPSL